MRPSRHLLPVLACLLVLAAPSARADVIVVDALGGGDFTQVQPAIDAAAAGDMLLIEPGNYTTALFARIDGKSLVLVGDVGGTAFLPPLQIVNLPAGSSVVVRNLTLAPSGIAFLLGGTASIQVNDGAVYFEDCTINGANGTPGFQGQIANPGQAAVWLFESEGVSFQRCTISGGKGQNTISAPFPLGQFATSDAGQGAVVRSSKAAFYDCVILGGRGGDDNLGFATKGGNGGRGIDAQSSRVFVSGCLIEAGDGGNGCSPAQVVEGCMGGHGVAQINAGSSLQELDSTLAAGVGGTVDGGGTGTDGVDRSLGGGLHYPFTGSFVGLHKVSPLRSGETGTMTITGPEGSLFVSFFGFGASYLPLFHFKGVFLASFPIEGPLLLAVVPPGGVFAVDYIAPSIAEFGLEGFVTVDQVFMDQGLDGVILSGASTHIQVDSDF